MTRDNIVPFDPTVDQPRRRPLDARFEPIVDEIRSKVLDTLPKLLQDLFEHLDDDLYQLADKSANDALETQYFGAMRELRKQRQGIERRYLDTRKRAFDAFWAASVQPSPRVMEFGELALVEAPELEESLAITAMASKSENRFHRELFALGKRFAAMRGETDIKVSENPIGPHALAGGFAEALSQWEGETPVRLLILKLFDRYVMAYVGGLYDEVNDVMVAANILPKVVQRAHRNPVSPSVQRARDPENRGGVSGEAATPENMETLALLGQLVAKRHLGGQFSALRSVPQGGGASLPEVSTPDLLDALENVQRMTLQSAPASLEEIQRMQMELVQSLGRELDLGPEGQRTRRLGSADQDVLGIIEMLFDFILGDANLPEAMRALLGRLQIPLIKVAVRDREFFNNRKHPARQLLNTLARAAVAWTDDGDRSENSPYGRIETAVNKVLSEFVDNPQLFADVLDDFERYMEREQRTAQVAEDRVTQVKRGQEQLELARRHVDQTIMGHLRACQAPACQVPEAVSRLIDEAWRDVLLLAYLREGVDSRAWKSADELVGVLIWSVQPKHEQSERQELLKVIPDLLKRLRDGLVNISYDQHRANALFKELQGNHIQALRGKFPAAEKMNDVPMAAVEAAPEQPEVERDAYYTRAESMQIGQWLEWEQAKDIALRGKLTWRSEVSGNCIFVGRKGAKLAEMELAEVAGLLREGRARILLGVDQPLMDRALNAMMDALQSTGGHA